MKNVFWATVLLICAGAMVSGAACAAIDWQSASQIEAPKNFISFAVSMDGQRTFFLTAGGEVLIYSQGKLDDKIHPGGEFDGIGCSPDGAKIFLSNRSAGTLQTIDLEYIKNINISDAPSRGPSSAPVKVVMFNDFQ
jgi:hypothetical protein